MVQIEPPAKPAGPRPPITPSRPESFVRSRRAIRIILRQGSEADGVIADWIDALHGIGMEHSAAIRNILRAAISGHPFVTPLGHIHYTPCPISSAAEPAPAETKTHITDADRLLLKELRIQMRGGSQ